MDTSVEVRSDRLNWSTGVLALMIRPAWPSLRWWLARRGMAGPVAQYGCGWTYLRLFGEDTPLSIDAAAEPDGDVLKDGSYERRPLYDGTPRKFVVAAAKLNISRQTQGEGQR